MNLDLHLHSVFSGDSPVPPEEYAARMAKMRAEYDVSGFALMEHNRFIRPADCDLAALGRDYGLVVLAGVEVDTYWGHLLVYGMTDRLWESISANGRGKQEPVRLSRLIADEGALAVPAHPFRGWIGMGERARGLHGLCVVETLNGANSAEENLAAREFAKRQGIAGTGGSDGHFLAELGKGLTSLERPVASMTELVAELKVGRCRPLELEAARLGPGGEK